MAYLFGANVCCKLSTLIIFVDLFPPAVFFTCCSISIALLAPNFSGLSGEGKRNEATSGGRVDGGVDTYRRKDHSININLKKKKTTKLHRIKVNETGKISC